MGGGAAGPPDERRVVYGGSDRIFRNGGCGRWWVGNVAMREMISEDKMVMQLIVEALLLPPWALDRLRDLV